MKETAASSEWIGRIVTQLDTVRVFACTGKDRIEENFRARWPTMNEISYEGWSIGKEKSMMLTVPMKVEEVHCQIDWQRHRYQVADGLKIPFAVQGLRLRLVDFEYLG